MIQEVTAIMQILSDTIKVSGEMALFGLAGYALFKLLTLASYLMLAKYIARRFFDWVTKDKPLVINVPTALDKQTETGIQMQLSRLQAPGRYLHYSDVKILKEALDKVLVV